MQRKMSGEKCERMRHLNPAEFRTRCADFVREHSAAIAAAQPEIPAVLNDRAADIWEPLFAIADLAGGDWPEFARQAGLKLSGYDDDVPLIGYLLSDVRDWMLIRKTDRVLSRHLVSSFKASSHRAWEDLRRGREINEHWLAAKMRDLGIRPTYIRIAEVTGRGYLLSEVESAFRRYVPNPEPHSVSKPESPNTNAALNSQI